jgi:hypothetical protein
VPVTGGHRDAAAPKKSCDNMTTRAGRCPPVRTRIAAAAALRMRSGQVVRARRAVDDRQRSSSTAGQSVQRGLASAGQLGGGWSADAARQHGSNIMNGRTKALLALCLAALGACGGSDDSPPPPPPPIIVNSLQDTATPPSGTVTLRSALAAAASGQAIRFDRQLDGGTIALTIVADEHTLLKGEVMGIRNEPSGPVSYLVGYFDRDYGRSALVARKSVVIDASDLPNGITLAWTGGDTPGARVLAVEGDLTLVNVAITGGRSITSALNPPYGAYQQPWTLGRGGAVAVWGVARLSNCRLYGNRAQGDFEPSRDRGAYGGAVYADIVDMDHCVVAGNDVLGGGAAGGGVYSVGGAGNARTTSTIARSTISGNRIRGLFAYGGGLYSDGGSIGNSKTLRVTSSTIARNLVATPPGLPPSLLQAQGYWRGGGIYMSNGMLELLASTVAENETQGLPRTDSRGRRNLAGGIAATVGDAHGVEHMIIAHSVVAGNAVQEVAGARYAHDIFTGSLMHFRSAGYNRFGTIDFSQMLVPIGEWGWQSLSRRHYPQPGDRDGVGAGDVLDLAGGVTRSASIVSVGIDAGQPAVLHYRPTGTALDEVPAVAYGVSETWAQYGVAPGGTDNFLQILLGRVERQYGLAGFAASFRADYEAWLQSVDTDAAATGVQPYANPQGVPILTLADTHFFGPAQTWPREASNQPLIEFWHRLDAALAAQAIPALGPQGLGDAAWRALFSSGPLAENGSIAVAVDTRTRLTAQRPDVDQLGQARPAGAPSDIGAIERP